MSLMQGVRGDISWDTDSINWTLIATVHLRSYNSRDSKHLMDLQLIAIVGWRSNGCIKRRVFSKRSTWTHPDAPSPIERMRLNLTISIKRRVISAVDRDEPLDPTVTPNFSINWMFFRDGKDTLGFSRLIELFRHQNSSVIQFLSLLDTFLRSRSVWNWKLIERIRRNHILNAIFVFEIAEWIAMQPAINWIISSATLG